MVHSSVAVTHNPKTRTRAHGFWGLWVTAAAPVEDSISLPLAPLNPLTERRSMGDLGEQGELNHSLFLLESGSATSSPPSSDRWLVSWCGSAPHGRPGRPTSLLLDFTGTGWDLRILITVTGGHQPKTTAFGQDEASVRLPRVIKLKRIRLSGVAGVPK